MTEQRTQRMTKQRRIILEELRKLKTHPTADELYGIVRERLPRISLGTVYRNLDVLFENGEVLKLEAAGNQKRFDGDVSPHSHVRCIRCGRLGDVMQRTGGVDVEGYTAPGFEITHASIEFYGVCDDCAELERNSPPAGAEGRQ